MQAEFAAGHTVAVHTYTHDYATIYASDTAYWEDFDMQRANVESVTGQPVHFFRFPGGASNTVSANYCSGIMTTLAQESVEKGLVYVDWNVSSGDASGDATKESVIDNILTQVEYYDQSVVLCHDTKDYTVEAMDTIIPQLQAQGYTFLPYSDKSELVQHGIAN